MELITAHPVRRRRLAALLITALVLAACGGGATDDSVAVDTDADPSREGSVAISQEYLAEVADATEAVDRARFEAFLEMEISDGTETYTLGADAPLMRGEQDGERVHMVMDLAAMFEGLIDQVPADERDELAAMLGAGDLTIEMVIDGLDLYIRAPFFQTMMGVDPGGAPDPSTLGPAADLLTLGDGWGHVDLGAATDVDPAELAAMLSGSQSMDPAAMVALLREAGSVEELGATNVRGVETEGVRARVSLGDLVESGGTDVSQMLSAFGGDTVTEAMFGVELPIEVHVDGDGLLRRMVMRFDENSVRQIMSATGETLPPGSYFEMDMTVDMFDYGDDTIAITPPTGEVVDLTEAFMAMGQFGL